MEKERKANVEYEKKSKVEGKERGGRYKCSRKYREI